MSAYAVLLLPLGMAALALVVLVVTLVVRVVGRRRRAAQLGEWAAGRGWGFVLRDDDAARARPCWPVDRGGRSAHVLRGPGGIVAFEWVFIEVIGSGGVDSSPSRRSFDARYVMLARDPARAAHLFPPALLEGFATDPRTSVAGLRVADGTVTTFRRGRLTPQSLERLLAVAETLRTGLRP